jgi:integrase
VSTSLDRPANRQPATISLTLGPDELAYAAKARSANTLKGYRSDWAEWSAWCAAHGTDPMPADPVAVAKYLTSLARHGAKVGTMSRRLSSIRFAETAAGISSQLDDAIVATVWEGIRRTHGAPPEQSLPIMPPLLWAMLDATPTTTDAGKIVLSALRDHVLLLVGFVGALRRSELVGIDVEHLEAHDKGLVLHIPRSKINQTGDTDELVVLPSSPTPGRCPVAAIRAWRNATNINTGPLLRGLTRTQLPRATRMNDASINMLVKAAIARTGTDPTPYSAHGLRAGFVTYANLMGQPDRAIARQTRHRSLASLGPYVRIQDAWTNNAAVELRT